MTDNNPSLLLLSEDDNVFVALRAVPPGPALASDGSSIEVTNAVTLGHKIARHPIAPGEKVLKYGVPIGSATASIAPGQHVHVHNLASDYTATHLLKETAGGTTNA